jgi:hypothetical protein
MMKGARVLLGLRSALNNLRPREVREQARLPFTIQLFALNPEAYRDLEAFFAPAAGLARAAPADVTYSIQRGHDYSNGVVIRVRDEALPYEADAFVFRRNEPERVLLEILDRYPDLSLSLARQIEVFRKPVSQRITWNVAKENALFAVATAVPSMVPLVSLPWAIGEFASDTAFLTANQVRMAFMLAAAHDRTVGYAEQKAEIASVFAGAFGWRALARELAGKMPMGSGLVPKAAISFAATYVIGMSLERLYRHGRGFTKEERQAIYQEALERGKDMVAGFLRQARGPSGKGI